MDTNEVVKSPRIMEALEEDVSEKKTRMSSILRPLFIAQALCGCYNFSDLSRYSRSPKITIGKAFSKLYRICYGVPLCLMLAKFIAAFLYLKPHLYFINGICVAWLSHMIVILLLSLKSTCSKRGHLKSAMKIWDEAVEPLLSELGFEYPVKQVRTKMVVILVITSIVIVVNSVFSGVLFVMNVSDFYMAGLPDNSTILVVLMVVGNFIASVIWLVHSASLVIISMVVSAGFGAINSFVKQAQCQKEPRTSMRLQSCEKLRLLHLRMCEFTAELDGDLCWFFGILYVIYLGMGVFILYQLINIDMVLIEKLLFLFWFLAFVAILFIVSSFAAYVHENAHGLLDNIYYLDIQDMDVHKLAQLNLFLSKLTGTQIGFTTSGLLTITKEFILTIAGVFLTYFAVLYTL